jgi:hypothetical protein
MSTLEFDDVRDRGDGERTRLNKLELDDMRDRGDALRARMSALREANLPPVASTRRDASAKSRQLLPAI